MEKPAEETSLIANVSSWNEKRVKSPGTIPSLRGANLGSSNLRGIYLERADLRGANLASSDLTDANLADAFLAGANFENSMLEGADLRGANFYGASLDGASLRGSILGETVLANVDLSKVLGLEECRHDAPSSVDFATLFRSKARIPSVFLVGCGLAHVVIENLPALIASLEPIQFYSCFIGYSEKDRAFAELLHKSLASLGIRTWFAPEDVRIGSRFAVAIDEAIRIHDKFLLVLSENSLGSAWVEREVEKAIERERRERRSVLFPVRLDNSVFAENVGLAADVCRTRQIADFTRWKDHKSYEKTLSRLARDLAIASAAEMSEASDA